MHRPAPFAGFETAPRSGGGGGGFGSSLGAPRSGSSSRGGAGEGAGEGEGAEEAVLAGTADMLLAQVDATRRKYAHEAESLKVGEPPCTMLCTEISRQPGWLDAVFFISVTMARSSHVRTQAGLDNRAMVAAFQA
jgi:hypothetical protein